MALKLFDHQKTMMDLLTDHDRFMLLAEQGVGKTLPVLLTLSNHVMSGESSSNLIIAPLSGLGAWSRDVALLSPDRQKMILDTTTFVNYDKLSRKSGKWQKDLMKSWDAIVLDEAHAIAKPTSNRTQYIVGKGKSLGLASRAKYVYLLTGTLINNSRLEDLWSPLRAVLGEDWMPWGDFKRQYLVTRPLPGSYAEIVVGYRHREELLDILAQNSYRVLKKDCLDLPEELPDEVIMVPWAKGKNAEPFGKTTEQLYEDALDSYVEALDLVSDNPLTRLLRMRQIATGHIKESDTRDENSKKTRGATHLLKSDKPKYLLELVQNNLPNKTVIGYQFTASCEVIEATLKKAGINYVTLNGDQKNKNIWKDFQADDSIKVIIVQYAAGSSAIDLFASSYTIMYEPPDSHTTISQFKARTHRSGQKQACNYIWLLTENSVEVDMYKRLQGHEDFSEKMYREVARARRQVK